MSALPDKKPAGAPMWIVTFADLMSLLVCFFVLMLSFSVQDKQKLQVVAGSMKEAFGSTVEARRTGIIEQDGNPMRLQHNFMDKSDLPTPADTIGPMSPERDAKHMVTAQALKFAVTAADLRQALSALPDILEVSRHIVVEETHDGLDIQIMDQDGRSMFEAGSSTPYEHTVAILKAIAPALRKASNGLQIAGHTAAANGDADGRANVWQLSSARADAIRGVLSAEGIPDNRFRSIRGQADTQPLFPDNPYLSVNRRVTITLLNEAEPTPDSFFGE